VLSQSCLRNPLRYTSEISLTDSISLHFSRFLKVVIVLHVLPTALLE